MIGREAEGTAGRVFNNDAAALLEAPVDTGLGAGFGAGRFLGCSLSKSSSSSSPSESEMNVARSSCSFTAADTLGGGLLDGSFDGCAERLCALIMD